MCKIISRIRDIADNEGITLAAVERTIGASKGVLSRALTNNTDIQAKWIEAVVENYPQYSPEWLLTGVGPMIKTTQTKQIQPVPTGITSQYEIPLLDLDASAGFAMIDAVGDNTRRTISLPRCDGAINIVGQSMEPMIHDGDIAVFDLVHSPTSIRPDGVYIVQYTDADNCTHITVKRVKKSPLGNSYVRLAADNADFGYEDVPLSSIFRVAKVLYTITKLSY